jgi:hypothetical protein
MTKISLVRRSCGQMTRSDRGQGDFENGLFTRRFAESDCALMQSHNLTANAQTQSGATCSPASGVVGAIKRFKQMGSVLRGNFWTRVSHCYYRKACLEAYMQADPALRVIILKGIGSMTA